MKRVIFAAALACTGAHAEFYTGNDINKWAAEMNTSNISWGMVYGYVAGAYDVGAGVLHCAPRGVTLGQIVDMTRQHIEANPTTRHASADAIITYVARQAWPCAKKGSSL